MYRSKTIQENTRGIRDIASTIMNFWKYIHIVLVLFDHVKAEEAIMKDRKAKEAIHKKELEEVTTLLEQLASIFVESEIGSIMNAHEFINNELKFYLNNPYIPIEEEIIRKLHEIDDAIDNEPIEEANNVEIGDVMVDRIGFKDAKSTLCP